MFHTSHFSYPHVQALIALLLACLALVVLAWVMLPKPPARPLATQSRPPATHSRFVAFVAYVLRLVRRDRGQA